MSYVFRIARRSGAYSVKITKVFLVGFQKYRFLNIHDSSGICMARARNVIAMPLDRRIKKNINLFLLTITPH